MNCRGTVVFHIKKSHWMRRVPATAVLLVLVLSVLAPACVAGWNGSCEDVPQISTRVRCARAPSSNSHGLSCQKEQASPSIEAGKQSGDELNMPPEQCALRSFVRAHFASFPTTEISVPMLAT